MLQSLIENTVVLFTDAATSPQKNISVGAFLCLPKNDIENITQQDLCDQIIYHQYVSNKSTWSEITTVINALQYALDHYPAFKKIELYTDCQSVCDLMLKRKKKLLQNQFKTKTGKLLAHAELYQTLFLLSEQWEITLIKVKGHDKIANRTTKPTKIFTLLDKLTRRYLRSILEDLHK